MGEIMKIFCPYCHEELSITNFTIIPTGKIEEILVHKDESQTCPVMFIKINRLKIDFREVEMSELRPRKG